MMSPAQKKLAAELIATSRTRRLTLPELLALSDAQRTLVRGIWGCASEVEEAAGWAAHFDGSLRDALEFCSRSLPGRDATPADAEGTWGYWLDVCRHLAGAIEVTR